jgi:dsRNA-specific ribonuclease
MNSNLFPIVTIQSNHLKRTRSESQRKFNASLAPPLPQIKSGDLILQVFTHKSLRRPNATPEHYGDNERLADLGKVVLDAAITRTLFNSRPILQAAEISRQRGFLLSSDIIGDWVSFYGLRKKLRCHPTVFPYLMLPQETNSIFHAYVGGLFVANGADNVNDWIDHLLLQENLNPMETCDEESLQSVEIPPQKRAKSETMSPLLQPTIFFASQPPPSPSPPRREPPPHLTVGPIVTNPLAPAQPGLPFLPLFNQAATQRRVKVEYIPEFSGPSHAGRWTVQCVVNGICKGVGSGSSKQLAKEESARQAYASMGWT